MTKPPLTDELLVRLEAGKRAATRVASLILASYQDPELKVETKLDKSVVTQTDREAETLLRSLLNEEFPNDSILGEEFSAHSGGGEFTWILDPIDGTQSFTCGVPFFGTMIGLTFKNRPVAGVIHMPALNETYFAAEGHGAWWTSQSFKKPVRAKVAATKHLKDALFCTTSHSGFDRINRFNLFIRLLRATRKFRGWGSCYGHMLVATGRADLMIDPEVKIWDCAAAAPIVTEAGGTFMSIDAELKIDKGSGVSCTSFLASELSLLLKDT